MGMTDVKHRYHGLLKERHRDGTPRWRVRAKGNPNLRIDIHVGPENTAFLTRYHDARNGIAPLGLPEPEVVVRDKSLGQLRLAYLAYMEKQVESGALSHKTLKKKRNLFRRIIKFDDYAIAVPASKIQAWVDDMLHTPAQAEAFLKSLKSMFEWGKKRRMIGKNPAIEIEFSHRSGPGTTPWSAADVAQFIKHHPIGTKPHVALSVLMWTGCRVEDLLILGRSCERVIDGLEALQFQPQKRGSKAVTMPLLPPLKLSVRAPKVQGQTYVLGDGGKPYASGDSMSAVFIKWCQQAGLQKRSAHGIRKGLAEILAEAGCTTYEIMSILGHSDSKTTEIYTRGAERWKLAQQAVQRLNVSHGWL
jgi:integrase